MKLECIGFNKSAILWYRSYLENRTFQVNIENDYSNLGNLMCGVPQGSILVITQRSPQTDSLAIKEKVFDIRNNKKLGWPL